MLFTFVFWFGINHTTPAAGLRLSPLLPLGISTGIKSGMWQRRYVFPSKSPEMKQKSRFTIYTAFGVFCLFVVCCCGGVFVLWGFLIVFILKQWMKIGKPLNTDTLGSKQTENTTSCSVLKLTESLLQNQLGAGITNQSFLVGSCISGCWGLWGLF